jgi:hypothetical protein
MADLAVSKYPALRRLGLDETGLGALARQGFVSVDRRNERCYHKLRFRRHGCQVIRYIGAEAEADIVRKELAALQAERRVHRALALLEKEARRLRRESRRQLTPLVAAAGLKFHGRDLRRPRSVD